MHVGGFELTDVVVDVEEFVVVVEDGVRVVIGGKLVKFDVTGVENKDMVVVEEFILVVEDTVNVVVDDGLVKFDVVGVENKEVVVVEELWLEVVVVVDVKVLKVDEVTLCELEYSEVVEVTVWLQVFSVPQT